MSATNNIPKPAIVAASTPNDVISALLNDKSLMNTVLAGVGVLAQANKSALHSKTLWVAVLGPIIAAAFAHFGVNPDAEVPVDIASALFGAVMFGMRLITKAPVTSVLPTA